MTEEANGAQTGGPDPTTLPENRITCDLDEYKEILFLETQAREQRHLHVHEIKPCAANYLDGLANAEVGMRNELANLLALEIRRSGVDSEEDAQDRLAEWWQNIPLEIRDAPGGRPFTLKDVESWVRSVYRIPAAKFEGGAGCSNHIWERSCMGKHLCPFLAKLKSGSRGQTRVGGLWLFLKEWLRAPGPNGRPLLGHKEVRAYAAIVAIEDSRGYAPGNLIISTLENLAKESGAGARLMDETLRNLCTVDLLTDYKKGRKRQKGEPAGVATQFRRVIPVPKPPKMS